MGNENGTWIMYGLDEDDPGCIHNSKELLNLINEIGFIPLFKNGIEGFSVEEHTIAENWWCGDPEIDPWEWRTQIAASGKAVYGKFFDKKAGFISKKWLPYFANYRRDGYDFESYWLDGKASRRQKKIMDLMDSDTEVFSNILKAEAGFGKGGEKNFEGTIIQGFTEESNVNSVREMVNMITLNRNYEANSKVIQTEDSLLDKAVNDYV